MSQYFPPYRSSERNIKVELDLSNYATKNDLKNISHVNISSYALKTTLASLKTEVEKLDIAKLTPVPNDLAKLSNVVKNDVAKRPEYNKLLAKVDNIDTTGFALNIKYNTNKSNLEKRISDMDKKIPDKNGLVQKNNNNRL